MPAAHEPPSPSPQDLPPTEPVVIPIRPNPYIVGNPVRGRSMFFGREAEFELVRKRFQDTPHGGLLVFCGERRSGKTSILFQILDHRLGPDFIPVLVDMQSMAVTTEADFLGKIAAEILQALGTGTDGAPVRPPDFTATSSTSAAFQRFVGDIMRAHPGRKLILLFDEYELFENKIEAGVLSDDTLHVLANLMENLAVFIIFTGSQHLEARRRDYWKILGKSIYKRISYLERQDAIDLIRKPVMGVVTYEDGAVEDIYRLSAGQPFYTQAVCQNLIDWLNEHGTRTATRAAISAVGDGLVENPLPQMIFLWDSLARDEKLVLALLAETLTGDSDYATTRQLARTIAQREYPLDLDTARMAPALEKLFKEDELLLKNDDAVAGYAFRMDLWRRWIRRMHSVWQVMRQEGFEIRQRPRRRMRTAALIAAIGVPLAALIAIFALNGRDSRLPPPPRIPGALPPPHPSQLATLRVTATPPEAIVRIDGEGATAGTWSGQVTLGRHLVQVTATGYADTSFVLELAGGSDNTHAVTLSRAIAARGQLDVRSDPPGARIVVDGEPRGQAPLTLQLAAGEHAIEATLAGRDPVFRRVRVHADSTIPLTLALGVPSLDVVVTTNPVGARVTVDRKALGAAPATASALPLGRHTFRVELAGYTARDTTVEVTSSLRQVHVQLQREPPGEVEVRGDLAARLYIDGEPVGTAHLYNWKVPLSAGRHTLRVVPSAGEALETSIEIGAGQKLTYEYTTSGIVRAASTAGGPR